MYYLRVIWFHTKFKCQWLSHNTTSHEEPNKFKSRLGIRKKNETEEWMEWGERREWGTLRTNEKSAGECPFLGTSDNGEGEPVGGNEGMKERHCRDSSNGWQIFSCQSVHYHRHTINVVSLCVVSHEPLQE